MGCGSSSDTEDPNVIKSDMKRTLIASYDELFEKISGLLEKGEKFRSGLSDTIDDMCDIANTDSLQGGVFQDAVQAWLWAVSSSCDGQISKCNLSIEEAKPYISWELGNSYVDCWYFQEKFKEYITTCMEAPKDMIDVIKDVEELAKQAQEFAKNAPSDAKNSGLNAIQAVKAAAATASNVKVTLNGVQKLKSVKEAIEKGAKELKELLPKIVEMMKKADEVGAKCHSEHKKTPSECITFNPKEKKSAAEIEKCKKEREKKKKSKKGKHEKKDDKKPEEKHEEKHAEKEEEGGG